MKIIYGADMDAALLEDIYALDKIAYPPELQGELANMQARFEFEKNTFVCVADGERLAGYINFFPLGGQILADMDDPHSTRMWDDDIRPQDMAHYSTEAENHLFIISVVIHPDYRDGETVIALNRAFAAELARTQEAGCRIGSIRGAVVSPSGRKYLGRMGFVPEKELDCGYVQMVCRGENLEELIEYGKLQKDVQ